MVSAVVFLADGSEEMELTIIVDVLRRAGIQVDVMGVQLDKDYAECSRGVKLMPDVLLEKQQGNWSAAYDAAIIPGGLKGSRTLGANSKVQQVLSSFYSQNKLVGFICAGTVVAKAAAIGQGRRATSYPAFKDELSTYYDYSDDRVVVDGNFVTSRSPGTTFLFALTLVSKLVGQEISSRLQKEMLTTAKL
ncbi:class I glutamine amidotransferase-like protein [Absidia repens]|uniref:D-lactate dehydratase n=1 Tax=Absidia repens TaxID=90262 RepID=A0A1X2HZ26_9FUNG|nr:class I glutamine amidotransferase-like protein [Absidia repens]